MATSTAADNRVLALPRPCQRCLPGSGTCHPAKSARTLVRGPALGFLGLGHLPKAPPSGRCRMTWCSGLLHHRRGGAGGPSQPSPQQDPSSTQGGLRRSGLSLQANAADSRLIRNGMWVRRCKDGSSPQLGTAATRTSAKKQSSRYRPWLLEHLPVGGCDFSPQPRPGGSGMRGAIAPASCSATGTAPGWIAPTATTPSPARRWSCSSWIGCHS